MSIVEFPQRSFPASGAWSADELQALIALFRAEGETSYATGTTEHGDPQFYLLGPAPAQECVLCVSRLAQTYVLEDGAGRLIGETPTLDGFAVEAARAALRGSRSLAGRLALAWVTIRLTIEEKLEPIFEESQELLVRVVPQVAAFV
ncbi:MAG TPA: hypothetical protein VJT13_22165 [Xanthobacteraceae bacterium]|nr:hypothetical protein [Xanthobacteraceae bacterium]